MTIQNFGDNIKNLPIDENLYSNDEFNIINSIFPEKSMLGTKEIWTFKKVLCITLIFILFSFYYPENFVEKLKINKNIKYIIKYILFFFIIFLIEYFL